MTGKISRVHESKKQVWDLSVGSQQNGHDVVKKNGQVNLEAQNMGNY